MSLSKFSLSRAIKRAGSAARCATCSRKLRQHGKNYGVSPAVLYTMPNENTPKLLNNLLGNFGNMDSEDQRGSFGYRRRDPRKAFFTISCDPTRDSLRFHPTP